MMVCTACKVVQCVLHLTIIQFHFCFQKKHEDGERKKKKKEKKKKKVTYKILYGS